ncbi:MAG: hypothetical protein KIT59_02740 [Nitrosomonas sp.]|nr:hypothetical protein [Nitrosomonas sp.]
MIVRRCFAHTFSGGSLISDQTLKEFEQYACQNNNFKFTEEYCPSVDEQHTRDKTARVCICTIQRMYAMLKNRELPEDLDEVSPIKSHTPSPNGRGAGVRVICSPNRN